MFTITHPRAAFLGVVAMLSVVLVAPTMVQAETDISAPSAVADQDLGGVRWAPEQAAVATSDTPSYDPSVDVATGNRGETEHLATVPLPPDVTANDTMAANSDDRIANALFGES